jgi:hypothetical protein
MGKQSTLTALAAVLFVIGLALLLAGLLRDADHGGGAWLWAALVVLAATIGCWFAAARAGSG